MQPRLRVAPDKASLSILRDGTKFFINDPNGVALYNEIADHEVSMTEQAAARDDLLSKLLRSAASLRQSTADAEDRPCPHLHGVLAAVRAHRAADPDLAKSIRKYVLQLNAATNLMNHFTKQLADQSTQDLQRLLALPGVDPSADDAADRELDEHLLGLFCDLSPVETSSPISIADHVIFKEKLSPRPSSEPCRPSTPPSPLWAPASAWRPLPPASKIPQFPFGPPCKSGGFTHFEGYKGNSDEYKNYSDDFKGSNSHLEGPKGNNDESMSNSDDSNVIKSIAGEKTDPAADNKCTAEVHEEKMMEMMQVLLKQQEAIKAACLSTLPSTLT